MLLTSKVLSESGVTFGTSGARGLVTQFTNNVCAAFTCAFLQSMQQSFKFKLVAVAIDNRPSSPEIAKSCIAAIEQLGYKAVFYGVIPTPALAYTSMQANIPSIMVTGSHIPFDRNGLKFYRPDGEISKADEQEILSVNFEFKPSCSLPDLQVNTQAGRDYCSRYTRLFDNDFLKGKRIGIYEHSSAGREIYASLFEQLGAEVIALERSEEFVPIDTEAVSDEDKLKAKTWSKQFGFDAIFSTDGDGDRPLIADEKGEWLRGDILGLLCAKGLGIQALAIPVSCNTAIEASGYFSKCQRTKIGSPYVIEEMNKLSKDYSRVSGFEANGGFILGSDIVFNRQVLKSLPTRDALLPVLVLFSMAKESKISELVKSLPNRVTYSDRIQNFATDKSLAIIKTGKLTPDLLLNDLGITNQTLAKVDFTDGLRFTFLSGDIIHLRPSGNAPELRCYAESNSLNSAKSLVDSTLLNVRKLLLVTHSPQECLESILKDKS